MPFAEPTCTQTPDGTYVFEAALDDGTRIATVVLPEDIDEITGAASPEPDGDERRRRFETAKLLAEMDLKQQASEHRARSAPEASERSS